MAGSDRRERALYNCAAWGLDFPENSDMRLKTALLMISLVCCAAAAAQSDKKPTLMYKWTDAAGVVHYSAISVDEPGVTEIEIRQGPKLPDPAVAARLKQPLDCAQLRENVRLLESGAQNLQVVENGLPRQLTEGERVPQLEAARVALQGCVDGENGLPSAIPPEQN